MGDTNRPEETVLRVPPFDYVMLERHSDTGLSSYPLAGPVNDRLADYTVGVAIGDSEAHLTIGKRYTGYSVAPYRCTRMSLSARGGDQLLRDMLPILRDTERYGWRDECRQAVVAWLRQLGHDVSRLTPDLRRVLMGDFGLLRGLATVFAAKWQLGHGECAVDPDPGCFAFPPPPLSELMERDKFEELLATGIALGPPSEVVDSDGFLHLTDEQVEYAWEFHAEWMRHLERIAGDVRAGDLDLERLPEPLKTWLLGTKVTTYWELPEPRWLSFQAVWEARYGYRALFDDLWGLLDLSEELGEFLLLKDAASTCRASLERARQQLALRNKDAAGTIGRSALERVLRVAARLAGVSLPVRSAASRIAQALREAGVLDDLRQKQIEALLAVGNRAAHGRDEEYSAEDVQHMLDGVELLARQLLNR